MPFRTASIALLALVALWAPSGSLAAEVELKTHLGEREIYEGQSFIFTITVAGPMRGSDAPRLPDLEEFALAGSSSSSNFSFVNGRTSSTKSYRYTLVPLKSGNLRIPAIAVPVKGKIYRTKPVTVSVKPAGAGAPSGATTPVTPGATPAAPTEESTSSGAGDERVFIRSWLDGEKVYVGQQLTHHFALFRRPTVNFLGTPQYAPPEFAGFWSEPLGDEISGYRKVSGQNYAVTELRRALFPSQPGRLEIGAATVHLRLRDRGNRFEFFAFDSGPEKVLRTQPLPVEVLPLPSEGKPADFGGTVASDLRLEMIVDPGPFEEGQPISVNIVLSGYGNPRAFSEPSFDPGDAFKAYDSELQSESRVDQERIRVEKRFTRVIVPKQAGQLSLPGVAYSWFDPEQERYRSTGTKVRVLDVKPSTRREASPVVFGDLTPERVELLGRDIHHIKIDPPLAGDGHRFPRSAAFWTFLSLPWPLLLGTLIWRKRRDELLADAAGFRARGARKSADRRLKSAEEARAEGDYDRFCAELAAGLRGYLVDRLALAAGFTSDDAESALAAAGAPSTLSEKTTRLLADCDHARYAPGAERATRMDALLSRAAELLTELDPHTAGKPGRRRGLVSGILPLLVLATMLGGLADGARASVDIETRMAEGSSRYEAGDFVGATGAWESLAREGLEDSRLWYNLGNAYFQRGRIGEAILGYRRALRLAPRDRELRDNLSLARARRPDGSAGDAGGGFTQRGWRWVRRSLSPGELAVLGLILLWTGTALLLLGILRAVSWKRLRWPLVAVGLLLPLISAAAWTAEWQDWSGNEAVLLAPVVAVNSGPGEDFITLFEIHEGAELRVREERGNWVRVSLGEDLEGWIPRGSFGKL